MREQRELIPTTSGRVLDHSHPLQPSFPPHPDLEGWEVEEGRSGGVAARGSGEEAKLTDRWGNRDPWREEAHRQSARAQLDAVFTHSNTVGLRKQL